MTEQRADMCPHCIHAWSGHQMLWLGGHKRCFCGCMWTPPQPEPPPEAARGRDFPQGREYLYEGSISAEILYEAFWKAAEALKDDDTVHGMDQPWLDPEMDMVDTSGAGMPPQFWEHMAAALAGDDR